MITKNIIWFFGPSCAGKATTIEKIVGGDQGLLIQFLGLHASSKIMKCEESLDKSKSRDELIPAILNRYQPLNVDILLIKGQTKDLEKTLPQLLRKQLDEVKHKIIFLWVEPKELNSRRLKNRSGQPWDNWNIDTHKRELNIQVEKVSKLRKSGFSIIWIDNTDKYPKCLKYDDVVAMTRQPNETD